MSRIAAMATQPFLRIGDQQDPITRPEPAQVPDHRG
jgi:hypothetical protein